MSERHDYWYMAEGETVAQTETGGVETGEVFQTLSNQRRRFVVHALEQEQGALELRTLSTQVAAWENDKEPAAVNSQERRRVYNSLQQVHLPQMDDDGLVEYDKRSGTIEPTADIADLQLYLEVVRGNDIPWSTYYLLLGFFSMVFAGAATSGVAPFASLPVLVAALIPGVLLTISGLAHTYVSRKRQLGRDGPPPELSS
ncbi:DUF7344 domain-containing protein [Halogranum rubrum]|uniref:DUF7344 domain-containing protein n=2 Tax=Halogranum rubrum TaxID=553466 RepID=J3JHV0_9EURY|nr:hypothetical protein [Halogranum salarium]EJN61296.1 hypothetical protein HSB1_03370 [Halogranum salarium B-1]